MHSRIAWRRWRAASGVRALSSINYCNWPGLMSPSLRLTERSTSTPFLWRALAITSCWRKTKASISGSMWTPL